jgi:hypothetical protein
VGNFALEGNSLALQWIARLEGVTFATAELSLPANSQPDLKLAGILPASIEIRFRYSVWAVSPSNNCRFVATTGRVLYFPYREASS